MNRPLFGFRPNLQNERHRRAWEILQAVPDGQKNAFLVQAILESEEKETFETTLRRVLREELQAVPSQPVKQPERATAEHEAPKPRPHSHKFRRVHRAKKTESQTTAQE